MNLPPLLVSTFHWQRQPVIHALGLRVEGDLITADTIILMGGLDAGDYRMKDPTVEKSSAMAVLTLPESYAKGVRPVVRSGRGIIIRRSA